MLQRVYGESWFYPNINIVTSFIALFYSRSFPIYNIHSLISPNLTHLKSVAPDFFQSYCRSLFSSLLMDKSCASCRSFWTGPKILCSLGLKCCIASAHLYFSHLHSENRAKALLLSEKNMGYRVYTDFQMLILLISLH